MPVVNTKGISTGFKTLPDTKGVVVTLTRAKNGVAKGSGNAKTSAIYTVNSPKELEGNTVVKDYTFTLESLWSFKGDMIKLGVPPEALEKDAVDTDKVFASMIGKSCPADIGHRDYEGRTFNTLDLIDKDAWGGK